MKDIPLDKSIGSMSSDRMHVPTKPQLEACMYSDQSPALKASEFCAHN